MNRSLYKKVILSVGFFAATFGYSLTDNSSVYDVSLQKYNKFLEATTEQIEGLSAQVGALDDAEKVTIKDKNQKELTVAKNKVKQQKQVIEMALKESALTGISTENIFQVRKKAIRLLNLMDPNKTSATYATYRDFMVYTYSNIVIPLNEGKIQKSKQKVSTPVVVPAQLEISKQEPKPALETPAPAEITEKAKTIPTSEESESKSFIDVISEIVGVKSSEEKTEDASASQEDAGANLEAGTISDALNSTGDAALDTTLDSSTDSDAGVQTEDAGVPADSSTPTDN